MDIFEIVVVAFAFLFGTIIAASLTHGGSRFEKGYLFFIFSAIAPLLTLAFIEGVKHYQAVDAATRRADYRADQRRRDLIEITPNEYADIRHQALADCSVKTLVDHAMVDGVINNGEARIIRNAAYDVDLAKQKDALKGVVRASTCGVKAPAATGASVDDSNTAAVPEAAPKAAPEAAGATVPAAHIS